MSSANGIQNINMDVIEIEWDGPYTFAQSRERSKGSDYGLYQIYGTHAVAGPNTLLYIGQSNSRRFNVRIPEHEQSDRFHWEPSELCIYFGRLGSLTPIRDPLSKQWEEQIDRTERLLIFTCTPPYNSQLIKGQVICQIQLYLITGNATGYLSPLHRWRSLQVLVHLDGLSMDLKLPVNTSATGKNVDRALLLNFD